MITVKHPYYLVAEVDNEDRLRIVDCGTLQQMLHDWEAQGGETSIGGHHASLYVMSEEDLEND